MGQITLQIQRLLFAKQVKVRKFIFIQLDGKGIPCHPNFFLGQEALILEY